MSFLRWFRRESTNDQCVSINQTLPTSLCGINMGLWKLSQDEAYVYLQHNDTYNEIISNTNRIIFQQKQVARNIEHNGHYVSTKQGSGTGVLMHLKL